MLMLVGAQQRVLTRSLVLLIFHASWPAPFLQAHIGSSPFPSLSLLWDDTSADLNSPCLPCRHASDLGPAACP